VSVVGCAIGTSGCISSGDARMGSPSWTANSMSCWKAGSSGACGFSGSLS
jgi:hypothetical protein